MNSEPCLLSNNQDTTLVWKHLLINKPSRCWTTPLISPHFPWSLYKIHMWIPSNYSIQLQLLAKSTLYFSLSHLLFLNTLFSPLHFTTIQANYAMTMKLHSQEKQRGGLSRALREQRAKLYIIRRCVVMLLCWHDWP